MFCRLQAGKLLFWCVLCVGAFGVSGGCGTGHYKAQADKEVYDIIDAKWQQDFGEKANYTIAGVEPSPNDVRIEHLMAESGVMCLADVVAIATAQNREYQRQKELLYLVSLDLTLERHQFARQWFGTIDSAYVKGTEDGSYEESVGSDGKLGFDQLLAGGAVVSTNIALDWSRFLTGDPRTSLGSVLSASLTQPLLRGRGRRRHGVLNEAVLPVHHLGQQAGQGPGRQPADRRREPARQTRPGQPPLLHRFHALAEEDAHAAAQQAE